MALHQVKIYRKGKLAEIIPSEKLSMQDDRKISKNNVPVVKRKPTYIYCEFCGDRAKIFLLSRTTCKKNACERKKVLKKKAAKLKIERGSRA